VLEDRVWIGAAAAILPGVTIGENWALEQS
jgi:acetyltransferase-like isoleucine patch superfamily enzyme